MNFSNNDATELEFASLHEAEDGEHNDIGFEEISQKVTQDNFIFRTEPFDGVYRLIWSGFVSPTQ